jgi:hypothetical protein
MNLHARLHTSPYLIRHLIRSCETINPSIFAAYSLQAEEEELNLTLEELINKFDLTYRPPKVDRKATEDPESPQLSSAAERPVSIKIQFNQPIFSLNPKKLFSSEKPGDAAHLITPPKTPNNLEQGETPEQYPNQGRTPPTMLTSSLGGGDKPFHVNSGGANNLYFFL